MPPQEVPFPVEPPVVQPPPQDRWQDYRFPALRRVAEEAESAAVDTARPYIPPEVRPLISAIAQAPKYIGSGADIRDALHYAGEGTKRLLDAMSADISNKQRAKNATSALINEATAVAMLAPFASTIRRAGTAGLERIPQELWDRLLKPVKGGPRVHGGEIYGATPSKRTGLVNVQTMPQDITWRAEPVSLAPRKNISIEDLQGSTLIPFPGDRLAVQNVTEINKIPVDIPSQGGPYYMRTKEPILELDRRPIWASDTKVAQTQRKQAEDIAERGGDPVGIYTAEGGRAHNQTMEVQSAMVQMIRALNLPKKDIKEFDDAVRQKKVSQGQGDKKRDIYPFKDWPGITDPDIIEYLRGKGSHRAEIVKILEQKRFRKNGFPDVASIRAALTEPELFAVPKGTSGLTVGRFDTSVPATEHIPSGHRTYAEGIPGTYLGGTEPIPRQMLFRDLYERELAKNPKANIDHWLTHGGIGKESQIVDQRLVDTIAAYLERQNR